MPILDRGILAGELGQALTSVIVAMRLEQPGTSPDLDRVRRDVKALCDLLQAQQTTRAQSGVSAFEMVARSNPGDTLFIERCCDLCICMLVEKPIDLGDD
jgi:hypothetical protein